MRLCTQQYRLTNGERYQLNAQSGRPTCRFHFSDGHRDLPLFLEKLVQAGRDHAVLHPRTCSARLAPVVSQAKRGAQTLALCDCSPEVFQD